MIKRIFSLFRAPDRGGGQKNGKKRKNFFKALDKSAALWYDIRVPERQATFAALAQLDRVFGYEPKGRGFESLTPRQTFRCAPRAGGFR